MRQLIYEREKKLALQMKHPKYLFLLLTAWIFGVFTQHVIGSFFLFRDPFGSVPQNWGDRLMSVSLSPDETARVLLIEKSSVDRNLKVFIQKRGETAQPIYLSGDLGKPSGSERVVWSSNSSKFILVGRHFDIKPDTAKLSTGENLYLLYDSQKQKLYCHYYDVPRFQCLPLSTSITSSFLDDFRKKNNIL
jgi:hypothetical protein